MDEATLKSIAAQLRKPSGERGIQVGEKMNEGNWHINLNTIEALQLQSGDQVLEIGMGNGFFVKNILAADPSIRYAGCDYSELMVEASIKLNEAFIINGQAAFFTADANHLPFGNETFDKVFTINTIYFWEDPSIELAEIWRVLKPGGRLIVAIRPKHNMLQLPFTQYGFTMYTKEELAAALSANGFTIIDTIVRQEPDGEMNGVKFSMEGLLVIAEKHS
jgi:ubiquinone/menaquinone biosynthesis C-methylase UbiE